MSARAAARRFALLVAASAAVIAALGAGLATPVGRPYPGFFEGRAGTRWTYTASGLTTNIAARLAALARGGELMVSEETWARLGAEADAEDLGVQPLKNVERPVRVFRLLHSAAP